jgi:hypothetical protein
VLRGDFEEDDTIIVDAVRPPASTDAMAAQEANVRSRQRGDGNYTSGLALRKGPKVGGHAVCVLYKRHSFFCKKRGDGNYTSALAMHRACKGTKS